MRSMIIGALLVGGLALTGCTPSERPSEEPPAPGTPPAEAPEHAPAESSVEVPADEESVAPASVPSTAPLDAPTITLEATAPPE